MNTMRPTTRLRQLISREGAIVAPGVADALNARLVAHHNFEAIYMTGAGTAATRLGMPDVGLLTMTEMVDNAARIADAARLPVMSDARFNPMSAPVSLPFTWRTRLSRNDAATFLANRSSRSRRWSVKSRQRS